MDALIPYINELSEKYKMPIIIFQSISNKNIYEIKVFCKLDVDSNIFAEVMDKISAKTEELNFKDYDVNSEFSNFSDSIVDYNSISHILTLN
jgi:hypothetical protein